MRKLLHEWVFQLLLVALGIAATAWVGFVVVGYADESKWPGLRLPLLISGAIAVGLLIVVVVMIALSGRPPDVAQANGNEAYHEWRSDLNNGRDATTNVVPSSRSLERADRLEELLREGMELKRVHASSSRLDVWRDSVLEALPMSKREDFRSLPTGGAVGDPFGQMWKIAEWRPSLGALETIIGELRGD